MLNKYENRTEFFLISSKHDMFNTKTNFNLEIYHYEPREMNNFIKKNKTLTIN